jgi:L-ascorbate metabolism protein UlaG (beta-lactamase superfamily)
MRIGILHFSIVCKVFSINMIQGGVITVKIEYIGHSCFRFTSEEGHKLLIDPFAGMDSKPVKLLDADVVLISHEHEDHNNIGMVKNQATIISGAGSYKIKGFDISGFLGIHGLSDSALCSLVVYFKFEIDQVNILHLSDIGCSLSDAEIKAFGEIDILLIPIGGYFTIDHAQAKLLIDRIKPRVTIPMHYAVPGTDRNKFPVSDINSFINQYKQVKTIRSGEIEVNCDSLPENNEVWVMTSRF